MDPPIEGNLEDENMRDANQPSDTPFLTSPADKAYQGEDPENDNFSGDTIALGSPENEIHNNNKLEGEIPLADTVPIGNIPDDDIVHPVQEIEDNAAHPLSDEGPRVEKSYRARLRKMLRKYKK